jgi:hypothetical protein
MYINAVTVGPLQNSNMGTMIFLKSIILHSGKNTKLAHIVKPGSRQWYLLLYVYSLDGLKASGSTPGERRLLVFQLFVSINL